MGFSPFIAAGFRKEYTDDRMRTVIIALALWASSLYAVSPPETAVFSAFRQIDGGFSHFVQLQRTSVTEELDLIIAMGSPKAFPVAIPWIFWTEDRKIGRSACSFKRRTALSAFICLERNPDFV